ncbi:MAG: hypothetical protein J6C27_07200 [Clostridia bacterium]|nr:hypothetical protein [Clostridia bacterium]
MARLSIMLFILFRDRLITKHRVELDGENSSNDLISQATGAEQTSKNETSEDTKNEQLQTDVDESDLEEANSKVTEILHQHNYITNKIKPTCTQKGYTEYNCACGDSYKADYIDALGHKVVSDKVVANTCTKPGLTEGSHCSVCNIVVVAQKSIAAKGHAWSKWAVTKAADVGVKGEEKRSCTACGETETRSIAAISNDNYNEFDKKIGVYHTENIRYEKYKNNFDYLAHIQVYTLNKASSNESNIINQFKKHFGFTPTAKVVVEKIGTYLVDGKVETIYSYSIDDKTYPFVDHELYDVYHQLCADGKSHWVGFAIEGGVNDDWGKLMSTEQVRKLKSEMYQMFYSKTGYSAEYIASHDDDFAMGLISQAGKMRTSNGKLIDVLYIYCREISR